jgi:hypothetical protein
MAYQRLQPDGYLANQNVSDPSPEALRDYMALAQKRQAESAQQQGERPKFFSSETSPVTQAMGQQQELLKHCLQMLLSLENRLKTSVLTATEPVPASVPPTLSADAPVSILVRLLWQHNVQLAEMVRIGEDLLTRLEV